MSLSSDVNRNTIDLCGAKEAKFEARSSQKGEQEVIYNDYAQEASMERSASSSSTSSDPHGVLKELQSFLSSAYPGAHSTECAPQFVHLVLEMGRERNRLQQENDVLKEVLQRYEKQEED